MKDWKKIVATHHNWASDSDGDGLLVGNPASPASISDLEQLCGFTMPQEFKDFYMTYNGMGSFTNTGEKSWWVLPLEMLNDCWIEARSWFQDTHPELASKFFPFIKLGSGDYSGYLLSTEGSLLAGLYDFSHEEYEFDIDQSSEGFLLQLDDSIEEMLSTG